MFLHFFSSSSFQLMLQFWRYFKYFFIPGPNISNSSNSIHIHIFIQFLSVCFSSSLFVTGQWKMDELWRVWKCVRERERKWVWMEVSMNGSSVMVILLRKSYEGRNQRSKLKRFASRSQKRDPHLLPFPVLEFFFFLQLVINHNTLQAGFFLLSSSSNDVLIVLSIAKNSEWASS